MSALLKRTLCERCKRVMEPGTAIQWVPVSRTRRIASGRTRDVARQAPAHAHDCLAVDYTLLPQQRYGIDAMDGEV